MKVEGEGRSLLRQPDFCRVLYALITRWSLCSALRSPPFMSGWQRLSRVLVAGADRRAVGAGLEIEVRQGLAFQLAQGAAGGGWFGLALLGAEQAERVVQVAGVAGGAAAASRELASAFIDQVGRPPVIFSFSCAAPMRPSLMPA